MPEIDSGAGILVLVAILAYLAGSVSAGLIVARLMKLGDLRAIGSGNIGATNVLRTGNKAAAVLTLLGDGGKAVFAVLLARSVFGNDAAQVAGLCAVLGHLWPVWSGFRGGKGVATFIGTVLALQLWMGLAACLVWLVAAGVSRMSSAGALAASALAPVVAQVTGYGRGTVLLVAIAALIWFRHAQNIRRILAGTEPKIGQGR